MGCGPSKEAGGAASPARAEPDIFQVETPAAPPKAPEPEPPSPPPRPQASPPIVAASPGPDETAAACVPCDSFKVDVTADTFGLCVCGFPQKEHSAASRAKVDGAKAFGETLERAAAVAHADACDDYTVDVAAEVFGTCVCGLPKAAHDLSTSRRRASSSGSRASFCVVAEDADPDACDTFRLDVNAATFGLCVCGKLKKVRACVEIDRRTAPSGENFSSSVTSTSIRLMFGRIDGSRSTAEPVACAPVEVGWKMRGPRRSTRSRRRGRPRGPGGPSARSSRPRPLPAAARRGPRWTSASTRASCPSPATSSRWT
jgi:hypothetical protein